MPLPVRAASTVETSPEGHSSQSGAVAPTAAPVGGAAGAALVPEPLLVVAGIATPVLASAFEAPAPSAGVVETLAVPIVLVVLPETCEAAVVGETVVTPRLLAGKPSGNEEIAPPGSAVVVGDAAVAAVVVGDAVRLLGDPRVWARAAATTQPRQRSTGRRADRYREVSIRMLSPESVTVQTANVPRRSVDEALFSCAAAGERYGSRFW
jgi:hypothetical protein